MIISYSQLRIYQQCPFRYFCQYYRNWETPETKALTDGKEFHRKIFAPAKEEQEEMTDKMVRELWKNKYFQKLTSEMESVEKKQIGKIGDYCYMVVYDGLTPDTVVEFKTAAKEWTEEDFEESLQPHLYMKMSDRNKFVYFVVTKHAKPRLQIKTLTFDKDKWKQVEEYARHMQKDFLFEKNPGNHCYACPYQKYCPAWF